MNGENADPSGKGITQAIAEDIFSHGADVITTGNHCFFRAGDSLYEENEFLLCPANFPGAEQNGWCELDFGRFKVQVMNLSGAAGDVYVVYFCLRAPAGLLVNDDGVSMRFYLRKEDC